MNRLIGTPLRRFWGLVCLFPTLVAIKHFADLVQAGVEDPFAFALPSACIAIWVLGLWVAGPCKEDK